MPSKKVWEPVEEYKSGHKYGGILIQGDRLEVWNDEARVLKTLPDNLRLCRSVEEEGENKVFGLQNTVFYLQGVVAKQEGWLVDKEKEINRLERHVTRLEEERKELLLKMDSLQHSIVYLKEIVDQQGVWLKKGDEAMASMEEDGLDLETHARAARQAGIEERRKAREEHVGRNLKTEYTVYKVRSAVNRAAIVIAMPGKVSEGLFVSTAEEQAEADALLEFLANEIRGGVYDKIAKGMVQDILGRAFNEESEG